MQSRELKMNNRLKWNDPNVYFFTEQTGIFL